MTLGFTIPAVPSPPHNPTPSPPRRKGPQWSPARVRTRSSLPSPSTSVAATPTTRSPPPPPPPPPAVEETVLEPGVVHVIRSEAEFDALRAAGDARGAVVVVDYHAAWCRKCIYLMPKFRRCAEAFPGVFFGTVDINKVAAVPQREGISRVPVFHFYHYGSQVDTLLGKDPGPKVLQQLTDIIELHLK